VESHTTEDRVVGQPPPHVSEGFFREVNDRIVELGERLGFREETGLELICECDDPCCTERMHVEADVYQQVRAAKGRHVVIAGHARSGRVITESDSYVVVED
jgi:hypothetical protein